MNLKITNRILENALYRQEMQRLAFLEKDRVFCCHGIEHSLDTARITLIFCKEKGVAIDPDIIYSASLLHDIGRAQEYTKKTPHHDASVQTAEKILNQVECDDAMKKTILHLIASHRKPDNPPDSPENIFYTADKKSRLCFVCPARKDCYWSDDKKNLNIEV